MPEAVLLVLKAPKLPLYLKVSATSTSPLVTLNDQSTGLTSNPYDVLKDNITLLGPIES